MDIKIKLRNSASCWLLLYEYITMYGPHNVKLLVGVYWRDYIYTGSGSME